MDPLHVLESEHCNKAVDLFPGDQGYMARIIIKAQVYNVKMNPDYPLKAYVPYGEIEEGIVIIWRLNKVSYDIYAFSNKDDKSKLALAMENTKHIDWNSSLMFCCMLPNMQIIIKALMNKKGYSYNIDETYCAKIMRTKALEYNTELPSDVRLETLGIEHAEEIDNVCPYRYPGSIDYFVGMLERGSAIGIIDKINGELKGWILRSARGDLHSLHIKPKYRRNGYGQLLVKTLSKTIAEHDSDVFSTIMSDNKPSIDLFVKLGFDIAGIVNWMFCWINKE